MKPASNTHDSRSSAVVASLEGGGQDGPIESKTSGGCADRVNILFGDSPVGITARPRMLKFALKSFAVSFAVLMLLGLLCDYLVWNTFSFKFYSWAFPVAGVCGFVLFVLPRVLVHDLLPPQGGSHERQWYRRNREVLFGFGIYLIYFVLIHLYTGAYLGVLFSRANHNHEYYLNNKMEQVFTSPFRSGSSNELKDVFQLDGYEDFFLWMTGPVVDAFYCSNDTNAARQDDTLSCLVLDDKLALMQFRLRTLTSELQPCPRRQDQVECVGDLSEETEFRERWSNELFNLSEHCPEGVLVPQYDWHDGSYDSFSGRHFDDSISSQGAAGKYHRGGHWVDIRPWMSGSAESFRDCLAHMGEIGAINRATRVISLEMFFDGFDLNFYHGAQVQVEFLVSGGVHVKIFQQHGLLPEKNEAQDVVLGFPSGPFSECLLPPDYDPILAARTPGCADAQPLVTGLLWYAILLYVCFGLYFLLEAVLYSHAIGVRAYMSEGWNLFDLVLFALLFSGMLTEVLAQMSVPFGVSFMWYDYIHYRRQQQNIVSFLVLLTWIKLLRYAGSLGWSSVIANTLIRASRDIVIFLVLFLCVLTGFTMQFYVLFGRVSEQYNTIPRSFFSMVRALSGDIDATTLYEYEPLVAFFAYSTYMILIVFTMLTMLIAVINENFVNVIMEIKEGTSSPSSSDDALDEDQDAKNGASIPEQQEQQQNSSRTSVRLKDSARGSLHASNQWLKQCNKGCLRLIFDSGTNLLERQTSKDRAELDPYVKVCCFRANGTLRDGPDTRFIASIGQDQNRGSIKMASGNDRIQIVVYNRHPWDVDTYLGEFDLYAREVETGQHVELMTISLEDRRNVGQKFFSQQRIDGSIQLRVTRMRMSV